MESGRVTCRTDIQRPRSWLSAGKRRPHYQRGVVPVIDIVFRVTVLRPPSSRARVRSLLDRQVGGRVAQRHDQRTGLLWREINLVGDELALEIELAVVCLLAKGVREPLFFRELDADSTDALVLISSCGVFMADNEANDVRDQ